MMQNTPISFVTSDLCDAWLQGATGNLRVLPPVFSNYGGRAQFSGPVATVKCFEDNSLVKAAVASVGEGRVLVVDGGASLRRSLLGGSLAALAVANGWAGIVIDGCVRDVAELACCDIGIRALASIPMPTLKRQEGQCDLPVFIQGICVRQGDWLYADADGMVVMEPPLLA